MSIIWKPNGTLNVATDPCDLPENKGSILTGDSGSIISEAMQRCKNLRLDQTGVIKTRDGSSKLNSAAIESAIYKIICQGANRYTFANDHIYRNEVSIGSGYTAAQWSAIHYNAYNSTTEAVFAVNGIDRKKIEGTTIYEWGIAAPSTAPTITTGAKTGLTGAYNVKYTYCRKSGSTVLCESDPSDAATAAVTLANGSLSVTWTASSDSQVTHVRIYRTLLNGSTYYHDQDVAIGTTTVDTNTADGSLGSEVATDHDRPPLGSFVLGPSYNGTCFIIKSNLLYYCKPKQPEYWPTNYYIEVSPIQFPGQCLVFYNGQPYYLTKTEIYQIQGSGHDTFFPYKMDAITGCQGPQCAWTVHGKGIYHIGSDGVYLYSGEVDKKVTDSEFAPIFRGETTNGVPGMTSMSNAWIIQYGNKIYIGYVSSGYTYPTNILCINVDTGRTSYYEYGQEFRTVAIDDYNNRLLAGDNSGYVWVLESKGATNDNGTAISWEVQSKNFMLQTRAHFPRWMKYDVDASNATTATGAVYLDDTLHQSHTLSGSRNTKKRLVTTGNGELASVRISGTGPVSIYAVEGE